MSGVLLTVEIKERILYLGLNRPDKRNALNTALMEELGNALSNTKDIGCIILYGHGEHFSAGLDLSELKDRDVVEGLHHSLSWHPIMEKIQYGKVPVIAMIHGACIGGGLELASAAHIRIADTSAFYALPEGSRGIFVGGGGAVRLPRLIGTSVMMDMMLTGRVYKAEDGHRLGFSQYLVEPDQLTDYAHALALKICSNTPMTNFAVTQVLPRIADTDQNTGLLMEALAAAIAQSAPEAKVRLIDFLQGKAKKVGQ